MKKILSYWVKDPVTGNLNMHEKISYDLGEEYDELYINGVLQYKKPMLEVETNNQDEMTYFVVHVNGRALYGDYNIWNEMIEWSTKTFGPAPEDGVWTGGARWYVNNARFWFRDEKDREWFILRWS